MRAVPVVILAGLVFLAVLLVQAATAGRVRRTDPGRYRPRGNHRKTATRFDDEPPSTSPSDTDRHGAAAASRGTAGAAPTDFFTGAALDPADGIVRCDDCRALYHPDTVVLLAEHNAGRCVSCGGGALRRLDTAAWRRAGRTGRDADTGRRDRALVPEPSTPEAYAAAVGRLVSVSARVATRLPGLPGRRGTVSSLLVHDAHGNRLRLVFVGAAFGGLRGRAFVDGLIGTSIRVHGLLLRDEAHGLRLLVSDPAMVHESV